MSSFGPLVSTEWLATNLGAPDIRVVDGSWAMPGAAPKADVAQFIPGAVQFDIDEIADKSSSLPHMLAPQDEFERAAGDLGLTEHDRIICYDDQGIFSAARVWWTFRAMGHEKVAVLDGGLPKWRAEGRPLENAAANPKVTTYRANPRAAAARTAEHVQEAIQSGSEVILDARPEARFSGDAPEPRAGLRSGHMPGARSVPFNHLISDTGVMQDVETLRKVFANVGVSGGENVITTCGSGVTAAIISLALDQIDHHRHSLYDGSWTEWGDERNDRRKFPVVSGG